MPLLGFSGSNLATVAYAEVSGADGSSLVTNSGVATTRTSLGTYAIVLPPGITQRGSRDLIFVQAKANSDGTGMVPKTVVVDDSLDATKTISFFDADQGLEFLTKIDSSFSLLILRTTISPPFGAPA